MLAHSVQTQANDDVLANRHCGKGIGFLENHADPAANDRGINCAGIEILALKKNGSFDARLRHELMHTIERADKRRFAATARPDDRRHGLRCDVERRIINRTLLAVPDR